MTKHPAPLADGRTPHQPASNVTRPPILPDIATTRLMIADAESALGEEGRMFELRRPRKIGGVRPTRSGPAVEDPQRGGRV